MNNKGQTLVTFLLILPFVILVIALVIEIGNLEVTKNKYENEIKDTINYGLKHKDVDASTLEALLNKNIDGNIDIKIYNNHITISVQKEVEGLFSHLFEEKFNLDLRFTGYLENNNVIIQNE